MWLPILVVAGIAGLAVVITTAALVYYRFWVAGSTMANVVGPLRVPWWAMWVYLPLLVLTLLAWALAAGVGSRRVARWASLVALGLFLGLTGAWATGWLGTFAIAMFFPTWLREPVTVAAQPKP